MEISFHGATGGTTGTCHRIVSRGRSVLLDCGLFQGRRALSRQLNEEFGFDPVSIDAVVQSHAHIDHSGKLPMLVRHGFDGKIHATPGTRDLCEIMLLDSANIQVQDAEHLNRARTRERLRARSKGVRKRRAEDLDLPGDEVLPLYLPEDVEDTLQLFRTHEYGAWFEVLPGVRFRFHDAGHILGSAWVEGEFEEDEGTLRVTFTGDYGRHGQPILRDPEPLLPADVVISESTYGAREHQAFGDLEGELAAAVRRLAERGRGRLLIPAFAVGRTQHLLYSFARLYREGRAPRVPVVVDSPLATKATHVVFDHPELFDREALAEYGKMRLDGGYEDWLRFTESVDDSKRLNDFEPPLVIVSASGMLEAGRIVHHLRHNLESPDCEILIVGYQAAHTLGRKLVDGEKQVRVFGQPMRVEARVRSLLGFSAHADRSDLLAALTPIAEDSGTLFLVHGEDDQREPFASELRTRGFERIELPPDERTYSISPRVGPA